MDWDILYALQANKPKTVLYLEVLEIGATQNEHT